MNQKSVDIAISKIVNDFCINPNTWEKEYHSYVKRSFRKNSFLFYQSVASPDIYRLFIGPNNFDLNECDTHCVKTTMNAIEQDIIDNDNRRRMREVYDILRKEGYIE